MRMKVIYLVVTGKIKVLNRDYRCAVINQWQDLVPFYAHAERSAVASAHAENERRSAVTTVALRFSGLSKSVNPRKEVTETIKHELTCRSSCMRSFMAAEILPFPCRPPLLLDGRSDDGAGRRPTRWSEI